MDLQLPPQQSIEDLLRQSNELTRSLEENDNAKNEEVPDNVELLLGSKETKRKTRTQIPKLSEDLLMGEEGFLKLVKMTTKTKNIKDLMKIIQVWGHELYPRYTTHDFIINCEKLCRSRRMKIFKDEVMREQNRKKYRMAMEKESEQCYIKSLNKEGEQFYRKAVNHEPESNEFSTQVEINESDYELDLVDGDVLPVADKSFLPKDQYSLDAINTNIASDPFRVELSTTSTEQELSSDKLKMLQEKKEAALQKLRQKKLEKKKKEDERFANLIDEADLFI